MKNLQKKHQNHLPIWIQLSMRESQSCHICGLITHVTIHYHAKDVAYIEMNVGYQCCLYGNWLKANLRLITPVATSNIKLLPKNLNSLCILRHILEALIIGMPLKN